MGHGRRADHFWRRGQERKATWHSSDYSFSFRHCKLTSCEYDGIDEWYINETSAQLESEKKNKRKFREQIHIEFVRLVFCFSRLQFFFVRSSVSLRFSPRLPSSLLRRLNSHTNRLTIYYYFVTLSTVEPCLLFLFRFSPFPIFSDFSQLKGAYCNHDYHNSSLGDLWYKFNDAVNSWEYSFSGRSVMLVLFQSIL